jgi:Ribbon-helix-helix protein, copG family
MVSARRPGASFFGAGLFGWSKSRETKSATGTSQTRPLSTKNTKRIVCFRIDDDLDRRISRALRGNISTRSDFIRAAIERVLKLDAEERLRAAHSAIKWDG